MSRPQWFNPLEETEEGRLLKEVQDLLKEVKNKDKADLDKDGKLSGYETKRAKAIEESMAKEGYKSDRGQKPAPKMPTPKKNKNVIKFDMSDNCWCGANPHEECKGGGEMRAIDCLKNPIAFDSRFDDMREHSMLEHIDEGHPTMIIRRSDDGCPKCGGKIKSTDSTGGPVDVCKKCGVVEKGEIMRSDSKTEYSCRECGSVEVAGVDKKGRCYHCRMGHPKTKNPRIIDYPKSKEMQKSDIQKYSQESSVENFIMPFENVDGGQPVRAHGFTTNGTYPATNDGPSKSIISETAKIPAYAQTGYTAKSSSLHQHYNQEGGTRSNPPNIDTIEQKFALLTKQSGRNNQGIIAEIETLLKQVKETFQKNNN
jgi:hypothetical protein